MIVKPALATQGFKEATCIVEETISLGKRECKCGGFSNDDPYCESRNVILKLLSQNHFSHDFFKCKVGRVFTMVIWSEFRTRKYRHDDNREDASRFSFEAEYFRMNVPIYVLF